MNLKLLLIGGLIALSFNNQCQEKSKTFINSKDLNRMLTKEVAKKFATSRVKSSGKPVDVAIQQEKILSHIALGIIAKSAATQILTPEETKSIIAEQQEFARGYQTGYLGEISNFDQETALDLQESLCYHYNRFGLILQHHLLIKNHTNQLLKIHAMTRATQAIMQIGKVQKRPDHHFRNIKPY
jgi:hypothetical protein